MERKTIINIDSRFRDKQKFKDSSYFDYMLKTDIRNALSVRLSSIEFPNVFYTFTDKRGNTSFTITYNNVKYVVKIPEGSYDSAKIQSAVTLQFTTINGLTGLSLNISIDITSYKTTIKDNNNNVFSVDFTNYTNYDPLGFYLGYRGTTYSGSASYVSESIINISGDSYIYLKVNDYGDMETSTTKQGVIAKIILVSSKNGITFDNCSNFVSKDFTFPSTRSGVSSTGTSIRKIVCELVDFNGQTIDMLLTDYSFSLEILHV